MAEINDRIANYDRRIREIFRTSEQCQRLGKIEGIGPVTATALIAAVGDRTCFKNGRQFAAWLRLGAETTIQWRASPPVRYQQTWRSLSAHIDDPWRSRCARQSSRQAGSPKPLAWEVAAKAASQCRGCRARQQECEDRVGHALGRHILRARTIGESSLRSNGKRRNNRRRSHPAIAAKWQEMMKRSFRRFPNLVCGPAWLRPMSRGR